MNAIQDNLMNAPLEYSPKLKIAMAEINVILNNHDIAGLVFLYDDHKGEYLTKVNTTQSVMSLEGNALRFRSKLEDFGFDATRKLKADTYSIAMVRQLIDMMAMVTGHLNPLYDRLNKIFEIDHFDPVHTPHDPH